MTVLIANIGTSDLAIKVGDYYIPIEFRDEPNLDYSELTEEEKKIWDRRNEIIVKQVCDPLQVQYKTFNRNGNIAYSLNFRNLTQKIWNSFESDEKPSYREDIEKWQDCLCPIRIGGVLNTAKNYFDVKKVFIFLTNQEMQHHQDTYYLSKILTKWFSVTFPDVEILGCEIPPDINLAKQAGRLADYYYQFFQKVIESYRRVLVSIKGGTPLMQNELKMQTITSGFEESLFLTFEPSNPESKIKAPSIKGILKGKPVQCFFTSNWRYVKSQKYKSVKLLLGRWDFDGAKKILKDWQREMDVLKKYPISDIDEPVKTKEILSLVVTGLSVAQSVLNLDLEGSRKIANTHEGLKTLTWIQSIEEKQYQPVLNLYTQCRILWELGQAANFLPRFGSFYEEVLHHLFIELDGDRYFDKNEKPRWSLLTDYFKGKDEKLLILFADREKKLKKKIKKYRSKGKRSHIKFQIWQEFHSLTGRFSKLNFSEALVLYRRPEKQEIWEKIKASFKRLDYWFDKRNSVTHGAKGISINLLDEILEEDRKKYNSEEADPLLGNPNKACWGREILDEMGKIYRNVELILDRDPCPFIDRHAPEYNTNPYYIYSEAKDWIVEMLNSDR